MIVASLPRPTPNTLCFTVISSPVQQADLCCNLRKPEKLFPLESLAPELLRMPISLLGSFRKQALRFVEEERQNGR